jgi:hypothetical protein
LLKVKYGDKELWETVTFIAPALGEFEIALSCPEETISLIFEFLREKDTPQSIQYATEATDRLRIRCANWDDPTPITVKELLEAGEFAGRRLFLIFSSTKLGSFGEIRQVHLSVYLGEKSNG